MAMVKFSPKKLCLLVNSRGACESTLCGPLFQVAELQVKLKTSADNMEEQQQLLSTEVRTCHSGPYQSQWGYN